MERARRQPAPMRRPQHARPSVLASTRTFTMVGALGVVLAAGAAVALSVAGNPAPAPNARPAAVGKQVVPVADGSVAALNQIVPRPLGAADLAALRSAGAKTSLAALGADAAGGGADSAPASGLAADGIPQTALTAYENAAAREAGINPSCGIPWPLLAGIGRVESDHGRFAGAVLHSDGLSTPEVIGIPLNGHGTALILDTDGGRVDGDTTYDRAVGPMQFIPSTWKTWGVDGNSDGVKDPFNIFDAADAAADYLCAAGRDLTTSHGQVQAILSYNYSYDYVSMVMGVERIYATAVGVTVPVLPTTPDPKHGHPTTPPTLPPVDPGKPRGVPPTGPKCGSGAAAATKSASARACPSTPAPSGSTSSSTDPQPSSSSTGPQPSSGDSSSDDPGSPGASDPGTTDPGGTDPGTGDPGVGDGGGSSDSPTDTTPDPGSADVPSDTPNPEVVSS